MTRLLLTLLALLTGLAAHVAPSQARIVGAAGAEMAVQLPVAGKRVAVASAIVSGPKSLAERTFVRRAIDFTPQAVVIQPVLQGIDRARE